MRQVEWRITHATYSHIMDIMAKHSIDDDAGAVAELGKTFGLTPNAVYKIVIDDKGIDWPNPAKKDEL